MGLQAPRRGMNLRVALDDGTQEVLWPMQNATLDHAHHTAEMTGVFQWVVLEKHEVGDLAGLHRSRSIVYPQRGGAPPRRSGTTQDRNQRTSRTVRLSSGSSGILGLLDGAPPLRPRSPKLRLRSIPPGTEP